jgi:ribonucleoside-diphosphate reductase subunit M2
MDNVTATMFCKQGCVYCDRADELLAQKGIWCNKHELPDVKALQKILRDRVITVPRPLTFPQIFMDGKYVGGYEKLRDLLDEPLLQPNPMRFTPFPIQHHDMWEIYTTSLESFWLPTEIDLSKDRACWATLTPDERFFISRVLAFFASADGIVMENLDNNFAAEVQVPEARQVYAIQQAVEAVHSHTYGLLLDTYIQDQADKQNLFEAIRTIKSVKDKAEWAMQYMDQSKSFAVRLLAFACVEGLLFSGSFCAIYYLKKRGLMDGLCQTNEFIARDEALHTKFAVMLFNKLKHKPSQELVHRLVEDAVHHEQNFITESLSCDLIGMNKNLMGRYIEYVADRLLKQLGYEPLFNSENPFDWMEAISLDGKSNFFEKRNTAYGRIPLQDASQGDAFSRDDDF